MKYCKHSKVLYCFLVNKMGIKVLQTSRPKSKKFKEWPLSIFFFLSKEFQEFVVLRSSFLSNVRLELFFYQYPLENLSFSQLKCVFTSTKSIAVKAYVHCFQIWINHYKMQNAHWRVKTSWLKIFVSISPFKKIFHNFWNNYIEWMN